MKVIYFILQFLFLPHWIVFLCSPNKKVILIDLYARKSKKEGFLTNSFDLMHELLTNQYFRTLFYFRTPGVVSKILRFFYPQAVHFTIDVNTVLGEGVQLAHPYATILNAEKIGNHVYVNHLVTVGEKNGKRPIIGDYVQLHAGCIVIGGITIGKAAVIGAGAVVVKDVPENAIVVGNPARIIL
ncbi:MAG: hypothetical protein RL607_522 [Bacteroidota bacterium]|jgi:serine O-acetyltransferase